MLGKHSGRSSVRKVLVEEGIDADEKTVEALLLRLRHTADQRKGMVDTVELKRWAEEEILR
ncbi:trans-homoaconitate synthase [compost metagenome]